MDDMEHMDDVGTWSRRVVMASFDGPVLPGWLRTRIAEGLRSVCLFRSNIGSPQELAALTADIHGAADGVVIATDEEGGDVTRLHGRTGSPYPGNAALGSVDDVVLTEAVARSMGQELAAAGIDLDLAPVVDVNTNADNPVIGVRSFGAETALVARHASAYVRGIAGAGVGACAKHWPCHGDSDLDSHLDLPRSTASLERMRVRQLVPFAAAVDAGAVAVMTAHVVVTALDAAMPATLSQPVLALLRQELGFDGLVISDALDMTGVSGGRGEPAAAVLALAAGVDLVCLGPDKDDAAVGAVIAAVEAAARSGALPADRLAEAADRVVRCSQQLARLRAAARGPAGARQGPDTATSRQLAERVAQLAVKVSGEIPPCVGATVVRIVTGTTVVVGTVPWGVVDDGSVLVPDRTVDVGPDEPLDPLLRRVAGAPLVVLVRGLHRHRWAERLVTDLAAARPDVVVVEMGWPGPRPLPGAAAVVTSGAAPVLAAAADRLLARGTAAA